jgi:hypothetical protein
MHEKRQPAAWRRTTRNRKRDNFQMIYKVEDSL